jgi:hypothetical protein
LASASERVFRQRTLNWASDMRISYGEFLITEPCSTSPKFSAALITSTGRQNGSE